MIGWIYGLVVAAFAALTTFPAQAQTPPPTNQPRLAFVIG